MTRRIDTCPPPGLLPFSHASLPSDPETLSHQGGRRKPSASPTASPRQPAAGRRRPVAGVEPRPLEHREPQLTTAATRFTGRPEPDSCPSGPANNRPPSPTPRSRSSSTPDSPTCRNRSTTISSTGRPRWRRSSPTEPRERHRAWSCSARCPRSTGPARPGSGSRHLQTTAISLASPRNSTSLTHS